MHSLDLIKIKAIPDDTVMQTVEGTVKAIVCSHGHLDHIGAIPKLAHRYNCPIIATPYATELIRQQISGEKKFVVNNKLYALSAGQKYTISQNLVLEFVHTQHSIIDTVTPVLHTPHGAIVYACDFKFDRTPVIGKPPDFARFRQIGKEGVLALIVESTYMSGTSSPAMRMTRTRSSYPPSLPTLPVSKRSRNVPTRSAGNRSSSGVRWRNIPLPQNR
jgi:ribonuclease J